MRCTIFTCMVLTLLLASNSLAQVIIREKVAIDPKPRSSTEQAQLNVAGAGTIRFDFSVAGTLIEFRTPGISMNNCAGSQSATGASASVTLPARSGETYYQASWANRAGATATFSVYLNGELIRQDVYPNLCFCGFFFPNWLTLYDGFTLFGGGTIRHGDFGALQVAGTSTINCSETVWHPELPVTLMITEGSTLGEFVDAAGTSLGTSVTKKGSELGTIRFAANGQEPSGSQGTATIQAVSGGITKLVSFTVLRSTPLLDHFAVRLEPDTVEHSKSAVITVIAQDASNNEVTIEGSTPFTITVDKPEYGNIDPASGVTYAVARSGGVRYLANGTSPLTPQRIGITVSGAGKSGSGNVVVRAEVVNIDVNIERATLMPTITSPPNANEGNSNETAVFIRATRNDQPAADEVLEIRARSMMPSGGHEGHPAFPDGQLGIFSWNGLEGNPLTVKTNHQGEVVGLQYKTGEFSVLMEFIVKHIETGVEGKVSKQISVAPLVELTGSSFDLKPIETEVQRKHPRPYWVVDGLNVSLDLIASEYNQLFPNGPRLTVTDVSLQYGGRYEINGDWTHGSHNYHRRGHDVDLRSRDIQDDQFFDENENGFLDPGEKLTADHNKNGKLDLNRSDLQKTLEKRVPRWQLEPEIIRDGKIIRGEHFHLYYWR